MSITDVAVLALYPAIVVFAGWSVYLYGFRVIWPAWRMGELRMRDHALPMAVVLAAGADTAENLYYGASRLIPDGYLLAGFTMSAVGPMKAVILFAGVLAVAGYKQAVTGRSVLSDLACKACLIWAASFVVLSTMMR